MEITAPVSSITRQTSVALKCWSHMKRRRERGGHSRSSHALISALYASQFSSAIPL